MANDEEKSQSRQLELLEAMADSYTSIGEKIKFHKEHLEGMAILRAQELKQAEDELVNLMKKEEINKDELKTAQEKVKKAKELAEIARDHKDHSTQLEKSSLLLLKTTTGIGREWEQTVLGSMVKSLETMDGTVSKAEHLANHFARMGKFALQNAIPSMLMKIQESTFEVAKAQDAATAEFAKATGTGDKYFDTITSIANTNRAFGLSAQDSAQAIMSLRENMSTFTMQSMESQKEIATFASQLEAAYGVGEEFAVGMEMMTKGMGLNIEQSKDFTSNILGNAEALGINSKAAMQMFTVAGPRMAMYGKNGTKVFKGLMEQTKKTGLAMETLLGITEQFDTFEGASDMVANFNHLLGGPYLNTMEMMMATDEERIKLLQDHFKATGKSFDQMDQHTKLAIAKQMGFKDVNEAAMALNPNMIGLTESQREARIEQKALAEQAQKAQPALKQLQNLFNSVAIAIQPVVKWVSGLINWIVKLEDEVKKMTGEFEIGFIAPLTIGVTVVWGLIKAFKAFKAIQGAIIAVKGFIAKIFGENVALGAQNTVLDVNMKKWTERANSQNGGASAGNKLTEQMRQQGAAAKSSAWSMVAFGAAVALIGVGIYIAARGMAEFVKAFQGMKYPEILAISVALAVFGATIVAIVLILAKLSPLIFVAGTALLYFGGAVALIGVGIFLAAAGMSLFVLSVAKGFNLIKDNLGGFMAFVGGLTILSLLSPGLIATFAVLIPGLLAMAGVLGLTSESKLESLGTLFLGISNISTGTASAISIVADQIERIVNAINNIDMEAAEALGAIMGTNLPAEAIGAGASGLPGRASSAAQRTNQTVQNVNSGGGGGPIVINLHLDDDVLGKFVIKHANKETTKMLKGVGSGRIKAIPH